MKSIILFTLLLVISCSDDKFKKVEVLNEFRVLAILATAPEVAAGGNTTIQLYISDVNGGGRIINGTIETCYDPGVDLGATPSCDHDSSKTSNAYTIDTAADADLGSAKLYSGLATSTQVVTVPATALTGRTARDQFNGVNYIVLFKATVDGREVKAFRRIKVSNKTPVNTNPSSSNILFNGIAASGYPSDSTNLTLTTTGAESYTYELLDGTTETRTESLTTAWFVSKGTIPASKSPQGTSAKFTTDTTINGSFLLIAITRDERGGVTTLRYVIP